jgi:hypothetical protein
LLHSSYFSGLPVNTQPGRHIAKELGSLFIRTIQRLVLTGSPCVIARDSQSRLPSSLALEVECSICAI